MTDMGGVNPDLMGAAGGDPRFQQRGGLEQTDRAKPGQGRFAVVHDFDQPLAAAQHVAAQRLVHLARAMVPVALHQAR
jgi:hypothetical protein